MKNIVFLLLILVSSGATAQETINWISMDEALAAQKETPKKIFMDVYTSWCGPCKLMDRNTFSHNEVIQYINTNYYAVKFDAEGTEEINYQDYKYTNPNYQKGRKGRNTTHIFAEALDLSGYPSIVFFNENGELIESIPGYKTPEQIEIFLKMLANDDYLQLTTAEDWKAYQKKFIGTFKS